LFSWLSGSGSGNLITVSPAYATAALDHSRFAHLAFRAALR